MITGWIKVHRKVKDHWLYDCKPFDNYHAWEDILLTVERFPQTTRSGNRVVHLKPGQMLTSLSKLTEKWGWNDRSKTRRFLELLLSDGMVEIECNTNETLLTVVKWELCQDAETQMKHERNTDETPYIYKKNNKNITPLPPEDIFEKYEFSESLKSAINDWLKYKTEKKQTYKPTGLSKFLKQIENKLTVLSDAQVIFAIDESMANNWQGIVWDKAKMHEDTGGIKIEPIR